MLYKSMRRHKSFETEKQKTHTHIHTQQTIMINKLGGFCIYNKKKINAAPAYDSPTEKMTTL